MKISVDKSDTEILRQEAESLLKNQHLTTNSLFSEADTAKLLHELQVHQIELELQNENLMLAQADAQDAIELYDFAPSGYFTLSKQDDETLERAGEKLRLL